MIEFVTPDDAKSDGGAGRSDHSDLWKCRLKAFSETAECTKSSERCRHNLRVCLVPSLVPDPRQRLDVLFFGGPDIHQSRPRAR